MNLLRLSLKLSFLCFAILACSSAVRAQMVIRFVASYGNDANPCTRTQPCRTLQRGVDATPVGSELQVLDTGSYGPTVNITKSITISAEGVTATLFNPTATAAFTINIVSANIVLGGLTLSGGGEGLRGIEITEAAVLHIERCEIERFAIQGILLNFADTKLFIKDTVVRANGTDGLLINGNGTAARVSVENSRFENNGEDGMDIDGVESNVTRSVTSGNAGDGIEQSAGRMNVSWTTSAQNGSGYNVGFGGQMTLEYVVGRSNTSAGLNVSGGASSRISNSVFTHNGVGIQNGGVTETRLNNTVTENATNTAGGALLLLGGI
jgi:hypothetical protein